MFVNTDQPVDLAGPASEEWVRRDRYELVGISAILSARI